MTSLKTVTAETWPVVLIGSAGALRVFDGQPWFSGGLISIAILAVIGSAMAEHKPRLAQAARWVGLGPAGAVLVSGVVELASAM